MGDSGLDVVYVDVQRLTVGEIEQIEELTGTGIDTFTVAGSFKGKTLRAGGYVTRLRTDPSFTWDQSAHLVVRFAEEPIPPTDDNGSALSSPLSSTTE